MKIKDDFLLVCRGDSFGVTSKTNSEMFVELSQIAAFLWKTLEEKQSTKTELLEETLNEFDISTVLALGEIDLFIRMMKENEFVE